MLEIAVMPDGKFHVTTFDPFGDMPERPTSIGKFTTEELGQFFTRMAGEIAK